MERALSLPKGEQDRAFALMRTRGIFSENKKHFIACSEQSLLERERSQGENDLTMCGACKGFYGNQTFWKHRSRCPEAETASTIAAPLPCSSLTRPTVGKFGEEILNSIREDDIGKICKSDRMIKDFGQKLWERS